MEDDFILRMVIDRDEVEELLKSQPRCGKPKPHKTTYLIDVIPYICDDSLLNPKLPNEACLTVAQINNLKLKNDTTGLTKSYFWGSYAVNMQRNFDLYAPVLGKQLAATIIAYNDMITGEPVISLFPDASTYIHEPYNLFTYRKFLSPTTMSDFKYQRDKRLKLIERMNKKHK